MNIFQNSLQRKSLLVHNRTLAVYIFLLFTVDWNIERRISCKGKISKTLAVMLKVKT